MSEEAMAAKQRGNKHFLNKEWKKAIDEFSNAIRFDSSNHVFYSNRSACYLENGDLDQSLKDAEECIRINPQWPKGYSRKGAALYKMARFAEAAETYQKGLEKDSSNPGLREGLSLTQRQLASGAGKNDPFDLFKNIRGHVASNPKLAHLLSDPSFIQKVAEIEANPKTNITKYLNDPQIMQVFASLIGLAPDAMNAMNTMNANRNNDNNKNEKSGNDNQKGDKSFENDKNEKSENEKNGDKSFENDKKEKSENEKNGETEVLTEKQKAKKSAEEKKMAGNKAYKRKDFAHAVQLYSEAASLDPDNIVYLTNRAAVRMTAGDLEAARKDCEEAIERGRKVFAPFKQIAKAFERLGDIYRKEDHLEEAIEQYNKALLESSSYGLKKKLREIEERVAEKRRRDYIDPEKALEHKARGNELFQQSKWQEALEEYSESIKRNPNDAKVYCNRAAVYSKLMAWEYALNDCKKSIQLDKTFAKAYLRKGKIEHLLKDYQTSVQTYNAGLDCEPNSTQIKEAKQNLMNDVLRLSREGKFDKEHQAKAMNDPTVQQLVNDSDVREALEAMKTSSPKGMSLLNDPQIMRKLEVLMAAGIVQFGSM